MHKTFLMSFSDKRDDRRTHGHTGIHLPPLNKRYSPIISSICGPNKFYEIKTVQKALIFPSNKRSLLIKEGEKEVKTLL